MDNESGIEEKFIQNGVLLKKAHASYISALNAEGILTFGQCNKTNLHVFEWKPETCDITDSESLESGWSLVDAISRQPSPQQPLQPTAVASLPVTANVRATSEEPSAAPTTKVKLSIRVFLRDLKGLESFKDELRFYNHDHTVHSVYLFRQTSTSVLLQLLERFRCVRKSTQRKNFYRCIDDPDQDKLQKSFSELNIADIRARPRPRPYMDILSKWANVHQILPIHRPTSQSTIPSELRLSSLNASVDPETDSTEDPPAEPVAVNGETNTSESKKLVPRPSVHRGLPLDAGTWEDVKCPNGAISDPERIKEIIFRGGIKQDIRAEVWKYLLGLDVWEHTNQQRDERRAHKTQEYFQMKFQWLTMTATQEHNFTGYRERKCQIEKDVKRTDRTYEFFAGDDNPNLAKLQDILMTYVMYNFDLGYVQGMSDLLAPILSLVQNEAESFWCFVGFMHKVFANFDIDQKGMKQQLEHLRVLLSFVNERLFNYMRENQSENMYFCFRWLLVWFKREFANADIMQLWEVLWTGLPCSNFHLFVCVAILDQEMDVFIDGQFSFTEILKHVNELSGNLNLAAVLEQAESIYLQVKQTLEALPKESHHELRKIIGEQLTASDGGTTGNTDEDEDDDDSCMSIVNERSPEEKEILQRKLDEACDLSLSYMFF
uniref:TBC1 domain family member 15 n=1 Tax=Anopheles funestus TaxID=62324 RepID=A0A182RBN7_ANOFN